MISRVKWFTRNKWVGWLCKNSKVSEEAYSFICISKGGHYTIETKWNKQLWTNQASLGRWTCPIRHANSLGASIKDIYSVSCGNWERQVKVWNWFRKCGEELSLNALCLLHLMGIQYTFEAAWTQIHNGHGFKCVFFARLLSFKFIFLFFIAYKPVSFRQTKDFFTHLDLGHLRL